jgi:hypothetical protein
VAIFGAVGILSRDYPGPIVVEMDGVARSIVPPPGFSGKPDCHGVGKGFGVTCRFIGPADAALNLGSVARQLIGKEWRYSGVASRKQVVLCKRDAYVYLDAIPPAGNVRELRVTAIVSPSPGNTAREIFACNRGGG